MTVCRVEKTKNFTVMSNHHLQNTALSFKAKGLLSTMLSLPVDWDYTVKGLTKISKDGVDSINSAIKELEQAGYITRNRIRNAKGQVAEMEYIIREFPLSEAELEQGKPRLENPIQVNPILENHAQLNTKELSTNQQKIDRLEKMDNAGVEKIKMQVEEQIEAEFLSEHCGPAMAQTVNAAVEIMTEVMCSSAENINIGGNELPLVLVKQRFEKLNSEHMQYVCECLQNNKSEIKNVKRYLLATLFNAPVTIDSYYANKVNQDFDKAE